MRGASLAHQALRVAILVACLAGVLPVPAVAAASATPGAWAITGSMTHARGFAPAIGLNDGTVITAGGTDGGSFTSSAERWSNGTWASAGSIGQAAAGQIGALLPNGKALFAGGADDSSYYMFGDLFDPTAGTWAQTPSMTHAHAYAAAAMLGTDRIAVVGGYDGGDTFVTGAVDVYDATHNTWASATALPGVGRYAHTAAPMAGGKVLVAGGTDGTVGNALSSAYVFDGSTWTGIESMKKARVDAASIGLPDGRVLVAGGVDGSGTATNTAEVYDPATGHWTLVGFMNSARAGFTLTALGNGTVLAVGGYDSNPASASAATELFDPTTGGWAIGGSLTLGRRYHAAALLSDGRVLVTGGHDNASSYTTWAEIYTPLPARLTYPATTFHPLTPKRILDTRTGNGGFLYNRNPRKFKVWDQGGVPESAVAVTGILTTTGSNAAGYLALGPVFTSSPGSSTLNFTAGDSRANNVAVALDATGYLSVVFVGNGRTHAIFDVTGFFTADDLGATFYPIDPGRVLDSRDGTGVIKGKFQYNVARTFQVTGLWNVPPDATAVTGNLTAINASAQGWAYVGPSLPSNPSSVNCSMINIGPNDTRADGVTVKLGDHGTLQAVWVGSVGSSADLIFDVTGYFLDGTAGAKFIPLEPIRLVDTRVNLPLLGPVTRLTEVTVQVGGRAGVSADATGVSGNLTVTNQSSSGFLTVAPQLTSGVQPQTSTLNFPSRDVRANGFFVRLYGGGTVDFIYTATKSGASTHMVVDLTGYFRPSTP